MLTDIPTIAPGGVRLRHAIDGAETSISMVSADGSPTQLRPLLLARGHVVSATLENWTLSTVKSEHLKMEGDHFGRLGND